MNLSSIHTQSGSKNAYLRSRRLACMAAAAAALLSGGTALAQYEYEFFLIEPFYQWSTAESYMSFINDLNVGLGEGLASSGMAGILWTEAQGRRQTYSGLQELNNLGFAVSSDQIVDTSDGSSFVIPPPNSQYFIPRLFDLNDNMVGVGGARSGCSDFCEKPIIWDEVGGTRMVPVPNAYRMTHINNAGRAAGYIQFYHQGPTQAFLYNDQSGQWINLSDFLHPRQFNDFAITRVTDLTENGAVTGEVYAAEALANGFVWKDGQGFTFLPGLDGGDPLYVRPSGINDAMQVVGSAPDAGSSYRAFIWDANRGMRDLNDLVQLPTDFILDRAAKINDNGWIVGSGHFGPGWNFARGFVLKPIGGGGPELTVEPLHRGQPADLTVTGANPAERVYFIYSTAGTGSGPCPPALGGLCLDLRLPVMQLGSAVADGGGTAIMTIEIPAQAPLITVHTQAAIRRGAGGADSVKTDAVSTPIQP